MNIHTCLCLHTFLWVYVHTYIYECLFIKFSNMYICMYACFFCFRSILAGIFFDTNTFWVHTYIHIYSYAGKQRVHEHICTYSSLSCVRHSLPTHAYAYMSRNVYDCRCVIFVWGFAVIFFLTDTHQYRCTAHSIKVFIIFYAFLLKLYTDCPVIVWILLSYFKIYITYTTLFNLLN